MKSKEIYPKYKLWTASVRIKQPTYTGYIDVTVTAENAQQARQLMKAQYGVPDWHIGSVREVRV
jgi:capsule polysaccharide export protein KpsE/RkpR